MLSMMNVFDLSRQLNLQPKAVQNPPYHAPQGRYKIVHQSLVIPGLPAPLHYLNFFSFIGQPNIPIWINPDAVLNHPLDTATVLVSASPHMAGHLKCYSISKECEFGFNHFRFAQTDSIDGQFPQFHFHREDSEFAVDLQITTTPEISYFSKLPFNLAEHWSVLCHCQGQVSYQNQHYQIAGLGSFQYARSVHLPSVSLCFYTYQVINLSADLQILLLQIRNQFNQIVQSRCYVRYADGRREFYDQQVQFKVHRVYPQVQTPNRQRMYLPREFGWQVYHKKKLYLTIQAQSRGDFKFGLAAGYVGSFRYEVNFQGRNYNGEGAYCEYVDCRPLKWQENNEKSFFQEKLLNTEPCFLKK